MSNAFPLKTLDIPRAPADYHPATPPNEKTGVSYASATVKPASSTHSWSAHSAASVEDEIREGRRNVDEPKNYAEEDNGVREGNGGEVRRRRRRRDREEERGEWEGYEVEKPRRRQERKPRREKREREGSDRDALRTGKVGEDSVSDGTSNEGRAPEKRKKRGLVTAIKATRWAPIRIPFRRRLQTAAVLWHTFSILMCFSMFWFVLAIPLSWPLLVPYLIYIFFFANNHSDGSSPYRRSEFLRNLPIWRLYSEYFPIRLHRTVELDPKRNYIFAYQPHGIISHGAFGNFCTEATGFKQLFPGIKNTLLTLEQSFTIPFNREYLLAMGLASVSRESCEALLRGYGAPTGKKAGRSLFNPMSWFSISRATVGEEDAKVPEGGRAITIVIGGARESLEAQPGTMKLVLKKRRGFIKLAIREGAGVVPVLGFGENDLYKQVVPRADGWIHRMQIALKKTLGFTVPLIHARGVFNYDVGLLPYRHAINTVVGAPIFPRRQTPEPSEEEVAEFQQRYINELQRIWDEWKDVFADDRRGGAAGELEIIE